MMTLATRKACKLKAQLMEGGQRWQEDLKGRGLPCLHLELTLPCHLGLPLLQRASPISEVPTTSQVQTPEGGGGGKSFHCRWKKIHSLQGTRRTWAGTKDFGSVIPSSVEKGSSRGYHYSQWSCGSEASPVHRSWCLICGGV